MTHDSKVPDARFPHAGAAAEPLERRVLLSAALVADLNTNTFGSNPEQFVTLGDTSYFFATSPDEPAALWRSDGTAAGTVLVKRGVGTLMDRPSQLTAAAGRVFFTLADPLHGEELWTSDGTGAGTVLLKDINPGASADGTPFGSHPAGFTEFGGRVFFSATQGADRELWATDGTPAGTALFADLDPAGGASSSPSSFTAGGGLLYFWARVGAAQWLWRTDGTVAGTVRLAQLSEPRDLSGARSTPADVDGTLFFESGSALWKTDGTPAGTVRVKTFPALSPQEGPRQPAELTDVNGTLLFAVQDVAGFGSLWKSDGTEAGTVQVLERAPGSAEAISPLGVTALNAQALFLGYGPDFVTELWTTDGTAAGTRVLTEPVPGGNIDREHGLRRSGDRVYFVRGSDATGNELWVSDGTAAGTRIVQDIRPGPASSMVSLHPSFPEAVATPLPGGRLAFSASASPDDFEPWVSDGTPQGTFRLASINPAPAGSTFGASIDLGNGAVLFTANGRTYRAGPGGAAPVPLLDASILANVPASQAPVGPSRAVINGVAVFAALPAGGATPQLYRSDGTPGGTSRLGDVSLSEPPWALGILASPFVVAGGYVYFVGAGPGSGAELWRTDGTSAGTRLVRDLAPGLQSAFLPDQIPALAAVGGTVYFKAFNNQVWKTDGTAAGTVLVKDLSQPDGVDRTYNFAAAGGRLLFQGPDMSVWTSDGTAAGTRPLLPARAADQRFIPFGGAAYFSSPGPDGGLFRSDGTDAGTFRVGPGQGVEQFAVLGDTLFYVTLGQLWKTDGTPGGAVALPDVNPGPAAAAPQSLVAGPDAVYFSANDGARGRELWKTDGTAAGTVLVQDMNPGSEGSEAQPLAVSNGVLLFAATEPRYGRELWGVDARAPRVLFADFDWRGGAHRLSFRFSEDVSGELSESDLRLVNRTTGAMVPADRVDVAYDAATHTATFTFSYAGGVLPNGDYLATLDAAGVADGAGNALGAHPGHAFFALAGDVNRDRAVNGTDFALLAGNFGKSGMTYGQGDLNGDGSVNGTDFAILAGNFGKAVPAPPAAAALAPAAPVASPADQAPAAKAARPARHVRLHPPRGKGPRRAR